MSVEEEKALEEVVAPFAGAWIEIFCHLGHDVNERVAPFAGAWIEISICVTAP